MRRVREVAGSERTRPALSSIRLISCGAESAAGDLAEVSDFLPAHAGRGEYDALGQAIAPLHLHVGATDIEHLDHHLVIRAAIVGIDHAHAVGDGKSALE